ncbi:MAG TPA: hypothetical protein PLO93_04395, partial [Candidatus Omnitrophota bacterium]|nr:hypothetical protein [Candidatus Omnitrophota bacterium]
ITKKADGYYFKTANGTLQKISDPDGSALVVLQNVDEKNYRADVVGVVEIGLRWLDLEDALLSDRLYVDRQNNYYIVNDAAQAQEGWELVVMFVEGNDTINGLPWIPVRKSEYSPANIRATQKSGSGYWWQDKNGDNRQDPVNEPTVRKPWKVTERNSEVEDLLIRGFKPYYEVKMIVSGENRRIWMSGRAVEDIDQTFYRSHLLFIEYDASANDGIRQTWISLSDLNSGSNRAYYQKKIYEEGAILQQMAKSGEQVAPIRYYYPNQIFSKSNILDLKTNVTHAMNAQLGQGSSLYKVARIGDYRIKTVDGKVQRFILYRNTSFNGAIVGYTATDAWGKVVAEFMMKNGNMIKAIVSLGEKASILSQQIRRDYDLKGFEKVSRLYDHFDNKAAGNYNLSHQAGWAVNCGEYNLRLLDGRIIPFNLIKQISMNGSLQRMFGIQKNNEEITITCDGSVFRVDRQNGSDSYIVSFDGNKTYTVEYKTAEGQTVSFASLPNNWSSTMRNVFAQIARIQPQAKIYNPAQLTWLRVTRFDSQRNEAFRYYHAFAGNFSEALIELNHSLTKGYVIVNIGQGYDQRVNDSTVYHWQGRQIYSFEMTPNGLKVLLEKYEAVSAQQSILVDLRTINDGKKGAIVRWTNKPRSDDAFGDAFYQSIIQNYKQKEGFLPIDFNRVYDARTLVESLSNISWDAYIEVRQTADGYEQRLTYEADPLTGEKARSGNLIGLQIVLDNEQCGVINSVYRDILNINLRYHERWAGFAPVKLDRYDRRYGHIVESKEGIFVLPADFRTNTEFFKNITEKNYNYRVVNSYDQDYQILKSSIVYIRPQVNMEWVKAWDLVVEDEIAAGNIQKVNIAMLLKQGEIRDALQKIYARQGAYGVDLSTVFIPSIVTTIDGVVTTDYRIPHDYQARKIISVREEGGRILEIIVASQFDPKTGEVIKSFSVTPNY